MKFSRIYAIGCLTASLFAQTAPQKQVTPIQPGSAAPPPAPATSAPSGAPASPVPPAPSVAPPTDPNKVILTIGDDKITKAAYDKMLENFPDQLKTAANGPNRRAFVEQLVRLKIVSQAAEQRKLDQDPAVQQQITLSRQSVLANALNQEILKNAKVDDAAIQKYYNEHKSEYEEVKAQHILIRFKGSPVPLRTGQPDRTKEEAKAKAEEVRKKLLAGEDFAKLAKVESDDTSSGSNGGDLGPAFTRGRMVPAFDKAAFEQPIGQIGELVESQFGYHIIKVEERSTKPLDQVKAQIENLLRPQIAKEQIDKLRTDAKVMIDEAYFGPTVDPASMPRGPRAQ